MTEKGDAGVTTEEAVLMATRTLLLDPPAPGGAVQLISVGVHERTLWHSRTAWTPPLFDENENCTWLETPANLRGADAGLFQAA